jgi:hypothetical protein
MLAANSPVGNAGAAWLTIPKSKMVLGCTAILGRTDYYREQSIMLDEVSSLKSVHDVWCGLNPKLSDRFRRKQARNAGQAPSPGAVRCST